MAVISKELFYEKISENMSCSVFHYWNEKCFWGIPTYFFYGNLAKGTLTFFFPIALMKMFLDYRRKKKNLLRRFVDFQARNALYAIALGTSMFTSICLWHKIFGRFYYNTILMLPAFISAPSLLVVRPENQVLNTLMFFNSFVETLLIKSRISPKQQVFGFMLISGILMYLFENRRKKLDFTYFWFFTPQLRVQQSESSKKCYHEEPCESYWYNGIVNYFLLGYGINVTKGFLSKFKLLTKHPGTLVDVAFNKSNSDTGLFLGAYVGIYRIVVCYLSKSLKINKKWLGLIAGTLAGFAYNISPNLQFLILGITTILQILYHIISTKLGITNHFYQRIMIYGIAHAYNFHNKFLNSDICSPYYSKMVDACANNVTKEMYQRLLKRLF
ncbi:unnamed protein product [Phyllotreta striolata]|uniref:Transmembrane protein 135 N-terminal domain-containing protein n=1 Tax=Phyllotreta striolata TaxID=444603 RepID=A0A9N9TVU4_PHYSR|nr:unnamed protein product [Phyllotreta striolata]